MTAAGGWRDHVSEKSFSRIRSANDQGGNQCYCARLVNSATIFLRAEASGPHNVELVPAFIDRPKRTQLQGDLRLSALPTCSVRIRKEDLEDLYYAVMEITAEKEQFKSRYIERVLYLREALAISFDRDWWPFISQTAGHNSPADKRVHLHDGIVAIELVKEPLKRDWRNKGSGIPGAASSLALRGCATGTAI